MTAAPPSPNQHHPPAAAAAPPSPPTPTLTPAAAASPGPPPSPHLFASAANAHLRRLRAAHARHLAAGADAALRADLSAARAIRHAAVVHAAACDILALPPSPASPASASSSSSASIPPSPSRRHAPPSPLAAAAAAAAPLPREYLAGLTARIQAALAAGDYAALAALAASGSAVLDALVAPDSSPFEPVDSHRPLATGPAAAAAAAGAAAAAAGGATTTTAATKQRAPAQQHRTSDPATFNPYHEDDYGDDDNHLFSNNNNNNRAAAGGDGGGRRPWRAGGNHTLAPAAWAAAAVKRRRCCGLSFEGLSNRDRLVLGLYMLMVLGALAAVTAVTIDFAHQQTNPGSFIRSTVSTRGLRAPVVTVCLSQTGVPFSRLQLFNFTDAEGRVFRGADPFGPQTDRVSPEFAAVVDRFWDNPRKEDCNAVVGDFYPFPLRSINRIVNGSLDTACRPCFRVGARQAAVATSTEFRNASTLSFFTDNYFLQCTKSVNGLNKDSLKFLHAQLFEKRVKMQELNVLSSDTPVQIADLPATAFESITSDQACNIFYFSFFPAVLNRTDESVEIRYAYNGSAWRRNSNGPFFETLKKPLDFLPEESLQMFIEANQTVTPNKVLRGRDMLLIGPNTQTLATLRPVIVYGDERYDVASSTSNFVQSNVTPIFGYWLIYKIFYNFNRFVTDEYYQESTYPVSQWLVDFTGYASLFTGASLFSLLLLPLLRAMRRRERDRLLRRRPEAYVWAKHRRRLRGAMPDATDPDRRDDDALAHTSSVMLPGYNV